VIARVAPVNSRVLITGSPGTGKELAARCIHESSQRAGAPFVVINSATITPENMEIELFGQESPNGQRKIGALEEAHGGTLFLDEIADMPRDTQAKILRVLVEQTFQRVGGTTKVEVDVRVISSSARDLALAIEEGTLREDLFHRLSVVPIRVPSLAERREDIPELVNYFMEQVSISSGMPKRKISEDAMAVLQLHDWPGNVRQLRNNVERLMILTAGDPSAEITADMLPAEIGELVPATPAGVRGEKLMSLPLREGISRRTAQPLRRKHIADGRIHWHGAFRPAQKAEIAFDRILGNATMCGSRSKMAVFARFVATFQLATCWKAGSNANLCGGNGGRARH
jgi:two-component system nitrogen regulation response regulator NtrX